MMVIPKASKNNYVLLLLWFWVIVILRFVALGVLLNDCGTKPSKKI
jgi:hypothetical protein